MDVISNDLHVSPQDQNENRTKEFYLYMTTYMLLETYTVILFWISDHDGKKINKK